jgi:exosome complex component CSL4
MATDARLPDVAVPGKVLGPATRYLPGPGTHVHGGSIVASLLGRVSVSSPGGAAGVKAGPTKRLTKITGLAAGGEMPTLSVARGERRREVLPDVGHTVLCRVTRLPRQAIVSIQQVGDTVLETEWQGVIRAQDVRATEKDKVKVYESFRPGDTVRAQVVCYTDEGHNLPRPTPTPASLSLTFFFFPPRCSRYR